MIQSLRSRLPEQMSIPKHTTEVVVDPAFAKGVKIFGVLASLALGWWVLTPSNDWAGRGDSLVKQRRYAEAYQVYMTGCNDSSLSNRMVACGVARDLRLTAKRFDVDTSNW